MHALLEQEITEGTERGNSLCELCLLLFKIRMFGRGRRPRCGLCTSVVSTHRNLASVPIHNPIDTSVTCSLPQFIRKAHPIRGLQQSGAKPSVDFGGCAEHGVRQIVVFIGLPPDKMKHRDTEDTEKRMLVEHDSNSIIEDFDFPTRSSRPRGWGQG